MIAKDIMKKDFIKIDSDSTVSQFANLLKQDKHKTGLVFDTGIFVGIVSFRHMFHARVQPNITKIGNFIAHVPHLRENTDILDIAYFMFHSGARILPVFDNDKIIGVVEADDLISQIKNYPQIKNKKVSDISLKQAPVVGENDRFGKLLQIMQDEETDRVPVVDSNKNLSGIVSFTDVVEKYYIQSPRGEHGSSGRAKSAVSPSYIGELPDLNALPILNFMNKIDLITAAKNETLGNVASSMLNNNVSSVIIVEGKTPVSIVTKRDLLGELLKLKETIKFLVKYNGLNDLLIEEMSKEMVKKMAIHHSEKLEKYLGNIQEMNIHFKQTKAAGKEGKRHRFDIHIKVTDGTKTFTSSKSSGWNVFRVLHDSFIDMENQLKHRYHTDSPLSEKRKGAASRKKYMR